MSTVKFLMYLLFVVIFLSHAIVMSVDGLPVKKKPPNILQKSTLTTTTRNLPKSIRPTKKSSTRDPRFLGKLSFVAGLHLPSPVTMSPIHRNDIVYKQQVPTQYVTTYNFPPSSWGPFAAAVYEPPPIPSFLEDPLGYLAAIFNPYNWFNGSFTTTNVPATITTIVPDKNQDEVFVLLDDSDNEIPNERRMDKIQMKMGHQKIDNGKYITKRTPVELSTTSRDFTTTPDKEETDADLVAEETTIKAVENISIDKNFEADSRQWFGHKTTPSTQPPTKRTEPPTRPTQPPTKRTEPPTQPTQSPTRQTEPPTRTTQPPTRLTEPPTQPTIPEMETFIPENITFPTQKPNMTSESNGTMGVTPSPTNTTSQTPYPLNNVTSPIYNHGGYYYGGYPKNVSHIELTTSRTPQIDQRIQNFNDVNQYLQPYQPNYYDFDELPNQQNIEFSRRFEQLPPLPNNYYDKSSRFTFNNMNDNALNGFKPSFPLHFERNF